MKTRATFILFRGIKPLSLYDFLITI